MRFQQQQQLVALLVVGVSAMSVEERDLAECGDIALELLPTLTSVPTPDLSLVKFLAQQTQILTATDACVIPAVTGSPASAYSSWMSELSSWQLAHSDDINSLIEACSDVPEIAESVSVFPGGMDALTACSEITWESPSATPSSGDDAEDGSSNDNSNDSDNDGSNDSGNDDSNDSGNDGSNDSGNDNNDTASSDNSNDEGGNGGSAATRETGMVAALAAVAMAGLISAIV